MIARLAVRYWLVFAAVLVLLSLGAYAFLGREYQGLLQPALGTPEAAQAYRTAMGKVTLTIAAFDLPLLAIVGVASWLLARGSIQPLVEAREREREFAADAAHRLRSPLATIAAVAQAARPDAAPELAASLDTIARAALEASQSVGELLTLARPAAGAQLQCEPLDMGALTRSVSKEFEAMAGQRGLMLDAQTESAMVDGDERRLRELLRNLLENSIRHARKTIAVASHADGSTVELAVSNDGDPIDPALRERIFDRAFSTDGDGSGLGLALVRWIARAHGGEVVARESPAGGAQFVVRLPALR